MQLSSDRIAIKANIIRQNVVRMLECAGSGHSASSLGLADIYATLYFKLLNYRSNEPDWSTVILHQFYMPQWLKLVILIGLSYIIYVN